MATATLKVNADITELMAQLDNIKKQLGGLMEQNKDLNNTIDKGFKDNSNSVNKYANDLKNAEKELKSQKQIIA
jgi:regulator of replication initiation timing